MAKKPVNPIPSDPIIRGKSTQVAVVKKPKPKK